jgi:hypothetical protein
MITFVLWSNEGIVAVSIKGKSYTYQVDAAMIPEWQRRATRTPGKVFNEVKRFGKLVVEPREESENTRCSLPINADNVLQRKEHTMAKAMNWKDLRSAYRSINYTVVSGDTDAKGRSYPILEECPDCKEVYNTRAGRKTPGAVAIPQSYTKMMTFQFPGKPNVKACPCGYRRAGEGKVYHSQQWIDTFDSANSSTPSSSPNEGSNKESTVAKCKGVTKEGKQCCNKAGTSGYCKIHTPFADRGF